MVFEGALCVGVPAFFMVAYYVVQGVRYFLIPVYGCDNRYDASWMTVVMFLVPPVIMCLVSWYYTCKPLPPLFSFLPRSSIIPESY